MTSKLRLLIPFFIITVLFLINYFSMQMQSQTFDESVNLVSGYYFVKTGKTYLNPEHPPLISLFSSLPLFLLKLNDPVIDRDNPEVEFYNPKNSKYRYRIANRFIYENLASHDVILFLARLPIVILSCALAFLIFSWSNQIGGIYAGLLSLLLYSFDPNFLAHGQLITMDVGLAFFYTLSSFLYTDYLKNKKFYKLLLVSLSFSCTILTKFPGFLLLFVFFIISTINGYRNLKTLIKNYSEIFLILLFSIVIVLICYRGNIGDYLRSLQYAYNHSKYGDYNFLFGTFSPNGWFYYFIIAFLVKTPTATLAIILLSLFLFLKNRKQLMMYIYIIVPSFVFFLASLFSTVNIGHRYILPVYPFLFIFAGLLLSGEFAKGKIFRILTIICVPLLVYSNFKTYPHYLSYFNMLGGGPERGHRIFVDSNIDWGQDLKFLKKFLDDNNIDEIYFAYFGSVDPGYYGIKYRFIPSSFDRYIEGADEPYKLKLPIPERKLFAVSVTYLYESIAYHWLQAMKPDAMAGYSIYIYDITDNVPARLNLVRAYKLVNAKETAIAELEQILEIYPDNREAIKLKEIIENEL